MKKYLGLAVFFLLFPGCATMTSVRPSGATRVYDYPLSLVFDAVKTATRDIGLEIVEEAPDKSFITARRGITAWSWGEIVGIYLVMPAPGKTEVTVRNIRRLATNITAEDFTWKIHNALPPLLMTASSGREGSELIRVESKSPPELPTMVVKSDVDELPSIKARPNKNAYAIVIGIENYRQKLPKADFATSDAETVTKYLTKVMGYPEENVVTLLNEHATNVDFAKYFEKWLPNNIEKDSSVFIYYSGHGAPNPKTGDAYLVPYDGDPSFIDQTGYSLKRLYDSLGKLQAKDIVVALDSCFSGAGGKSVLAKGARPLVMNMNNSVIPPKVAVLSAASGEQISSTYDEKGHGLFTYFMLKGLKGEAETNGSVDIENLFEYIKPQVERVARKEYNNEQTPQLIVPKELTGMKLR